MVKASKAYTPFYIYSNLNDNFHLAYNLFVSTTARKNHQCENRMWQVHWELRRTGKNRVAKFIHGKRK